MACMEMNDDFNMADKVLLLCLTENLLALIENSLFKCTDEDQF